MKLWDCPSLDYTGMETRYLSPSHLIIIIQKAFWYKRDDWLISNLQALGKKFCIVQTHIDSAICNHTEAVLSEITAKAQAELFPRRNLDPTRWYFFTTNFEWFERFQHIFRPERDRFMIDLAEDVKMLHKDLQARGSCTNFVH